MRVLFHKIGTAKLWTAMPFTIKKYFKSMENYGSLELKKQQALKQLVALKREKQNLMIQKQSLLTEKKTIEKQINAIKKTSPY